MAQVYEKNSKEYNLQQSCNDFIDDIVSWIDGNKLKKIYIASIITSPFYMCPIKEKNNIISLELLPSDYYDEIIDGVKVYYSKPLDIFRIEIINKLYAYIKDNIDYIENNIEEKDEINIPVLLRWLLLRLEKKYSIIT